MTDESLLTLSEESKTDLRCYAMMMGFMSIFMAYALTAAYYYKGVPFEEIFGQYALLIRTIVFILVLFSSTVLILLHNRDQVAAVFILLGTMFAIQSWGQQLFGLSGVDIYLSMYICILLMMVMMLFSRNEQRNITALFLLIMLAYVVLYALGLDDTFSEAVYYSCVSAIAAYLALCVSLRNPKLPLYSTLVYDGNGNDGSDFDFCREGASLGYMMFAMPILGYLLYYLHYGDIIINDCNSLQVVSSVILIVISLVMMASGGVRFTPLMFLVMGVIGSISVFISNIGYTLFLSYLVTGAIIIFREKKTALAGLAVIIYGASSLISVDFGFTSIEVVSIIMNLIPFLLCVYISAALCSDKRLPLI